MICQKCRGEVQWRGPLIAFTHTECVQCGAINSQVIEEEQERDYALAEGIDPGYDPITQFDLLLEAVGVSGSTATTLLDAHKRIVEELYNTRQQKSLVYRERNLLVGLLSRSNFALNAGISTTNIEGWDERWNQCVYIDTPKGQMSWHYTEDDKHLFDKLPQYKMQWDGHTTEMKYQRVEQLISSCDFQRSLRRNAIEQLKKQDPGDVL